MNNYGFNSNNLFNNIKEIQTILDSMTQELARKDDFINELLSLLEDEKNTAVSVYKQKYIDLKKNQSIS
jgi:hypothetical protein